MNDRTKSVLDKRVFRKTNAHTGRHISVTPQNSTNKHLSYGRIILNPGVPRVSFTAEGRETGLVVLSGAASISAAGQTVDLGRFDSIYIPRDASIDIGTSDAVDIAEFSADVESVFPLQAVRFADISRDSGLVFTAGTGTPACRHLHMALGKNIKAGRLVAGFTWSEPGNWTSWPPHEHTAMLEEMYVYFDMPAPAFGIQMVYDNTEYPELVTVVRDGDAVLMPSGYHPNVSVPGHRICFLWAMAAHREVQDRQFGVVNVQSGFDQGSSGLEAGRGK